jgi:polar amino acid transport system substrate-binding protein
LRHFGGRVLLGWVRFDSLACVKAIEEVVVAEQVDLPTATPGVLMVGIDDSPPPPMDLGEPGSAGFSGFEVDILEAVAGRLGLALRFWRAVWSQILDELERGLIDVVCTTATFTPERARQFDYGRAYLDMALGVVVRDEEADGGDVRGGRFAVRNATTAKRCIHERLEPAEVLTFEYNAETYEALLDRRADAVVDDSPIAAWFVGQMDGLRYLHSLPGTESCYAMVFAKRSPLRAPVDAEIERLDAAGTLDTWKTAVVRSRVGAPGDGCADDDGPPRALLAVHWLCHAVAA